MERADCRPPKMLRIPGEVIHHRGRHGDAGEDRQRPEDEDHREVGDLLQCVVAVKAIGLGRQMEGGVVDPGIPRLQNHGGRGGDQALPLLSGAEHGDEVDAAKDEAMHVDEVPHARHADGVPVAGRANERREIAGIVLRRPQAVARNLDGREADPLAARRAVVVEIEPGMIGEDGKAAADEHGDEEEVEEVAVADPEREAVRAGEVVGVHHRDGRNMREPDQ